MDRHVLAQITFGTWREEADKEWLDAVDQAFHGFFGCLLRNGQIIGDAPYGVMQGEVRTFVRLPHADALGWHHFPPSGQEEISKLKVLFGQEPAVAILDAGKPPNQLVDWQNAPWLVIYGTTLEGLAPVRDHKCRPVPCYLLPLDWIQCEHLYSWQGNQASHYRIWLASGSLEKETFRAMADPHSALNVEARDLARMVETVAAKPVYTEIYRYYTLAGDAEFARPCPLCGGAWKVDDEHFDFRCEPCRIVCNSGPSEDENDLARIGTWPGTTAQH